MVSNATEVTFNFARVTLIVTEGSLDGFSLPLGGPWMSVGVFECHWMNFDSHQSHFKWPWNPLVNLKSWLPISL